MCPPSRPSPASPVRAYKSGTRWALWRWTVTDSDYIRRLHLVKTPWFAVCLHWFKKPDPEAHLHDHPVSFLSLVLRGGYTEERYRDHVVRTEEHRWWNWVTANRDTHHAIRRIEPGTLTLVFMGPKRQEWCFHTEKGLVHWKAYHHAQRLGLDPVEVCGTYEP